MGLGTTASPSVRLGVELDHLPAAPQGVDTQVVGYGEQPGLEAVVGIEGLEAVVGAQEGLLHQVLDGDLAPRIWIEDAAHEPLVAADELLVGADVAAQGTGDQLVVLERLAPGRQAP